MTVISDLVIVDGELKMSDGSDVKTYLRSWQDSQLIFNGTPVNILDSKTLQCMSNDLRAAGFQTPEYFSAERWKG
jgi:hypothetical protein